MGRRLVVFAFVAALSLPALSSPAMPNRLPEVDRGASVQVWSESHLGDIWARIVERLETWWVGLGTGERPSEPGVEKTGPGSDPDGGPH